MQIAVQHAGIHDLAIGFGFDSEMREPIEAALVGPAVDLPIDEAPVSGQADTARAQPAQWE